MSAADVTNCAHVRLRCPRCGGTEGSTRKCGWHTPSFCPNKRVKGSKYCEEHRQGPPRGAVPAGGGS